MCVIDPRQCLRKGKVCSYIEMIEKRLFMKKGKKLKRREDIMSVCQLLFKLIQAARTIRNRILLAGVAGYSIENLTRIARLRLERKRRKTNTRSLYGGSNGKV